MAKAYGARPSSRQSQQSATPHDAGPAGRVTRATRAQSKELEEAPASQRARGGAAKRGGRKGKGKGKAAVAAVARLSTVEDDAEGEERVPEDPAAGAAAPAAMHHTRRESALSGISGTTAKTSFSQEEIGELDPDIMVDVFANLSSAADELAKLLVPADPKAHPVMRKEIRTLNTKYNKLYRNRVESIKLHKGSFGSTDYIQPSIVLRALLGVTDMKDVPQGPWRPDSVIYKFNLATMLRTVLILLSNDAPANNQGYNAMEELDVNFGSAIAGPVFSEHAFDVCLAILRQLCIIRLTLYRPDPSFNPQVMIRNVFFAPDTEDDLIFRHQHVLHMLDLSHDMQAETANLLQNSAGELIDLFDETNPATWDLALNEIKDRYPWEQFVDQIIAYYQARKQELERQIAAVGGINQIMAGLAAEVEQRGNARAAEGMRVSFSRPGGTPKKGFGKGGIKALKARERQLEESAAAALAAAPATAPAVQMTDPALSQLPAPIDGGWQQLGDSDGRMPATEPAAQKAGLFVSQEALTKVQEKQRQAAARAKKTSFVDRQEGAQRVPWDEFESQVAQYAEPPGSQYPTSSGREQGPYYPASQRTPKKRPHATVEADEPDEFDPTQDQGFENDTRDTAAADQRRQQAPQHIRPSQQRFSGAVASSSAVPAGSIANRESPRPSKLQRKNPGSTIPATGYIDPVPPAHFEEPTPQEILAGAKIAARHGTIRAAQHKPVQVRTPWSEVEEMALLDLIARTCEEGISYSKLKGVDNMQNGGPLLGKRSAEDMRFKARNMKEMFLKGRTQLPENFEHVVLDKKAIDKLHNLGIEYEQERIRVHVIDE